MVEARRVVVISDIHLGEAAEMMSRPWELATFIDGLAPRATEDLELVVAGDFIDYLAIPPFRSWTPDPVAAVEKLTFLEREPFDGVTRAFRQFLKRGNALTLLIGNHDVELCLPAVQNKLLELFSGRPNQVQFRSDGSAYTIGKLLIEHGNRYDNANITDWDGLRAMCSAQSRNEDYRDITVEVCAGSQLVERVLNPLKLSGYKFLDLIKPQNEVVALLLLALEPDLRWKWSALVQAFRASRLQSSNRHGTRPSRPRNVAAHPIDEIIPAWRRQLEREFGLAYHDLLTSNAHPVGAADWASLICTPQRNGVKALLERGEHIPTEQLRRIRASMRPLLVPDSDDTAQYGRAATFLNSVGFQTVVMGHTHLPRQVSGGSPGRASYINCGTWIDSIELPVQLLDEPSSLPNSESSSTGETQSSVSPPDPLEVVLHQLIQNSYPRNFSPNWAEIRLGVDGEVKSARLEGGRR